MAGMITARDTANRLAVAGEPRRYGSLNNQRRDKSRLYTNAQGLKRDAKGIFLPAAESVVELAKRLQYLFEDSGGAFHQLWADAIYQLHFFKMLHSLRLTDIAT